VSMLISDLSSEDRKSVEKWIKGLPDTFRHCESYLQQYGAGENTVGKLITWMSGTIESLEAARDDLVQKHGLSFKPQATERRGQLGSAKKRGFTKSQVFELSRDVYGALTDALGCLELIEADPANHDRLLKTAQQRIKNALNSSQMLLKDSAPREPWLELRRH